MIEVFKTNINDLSIASHMLKELLKHFPDSTINFDLEDCDRILRIENDKVIPFKVIQFLQSNGFECQSLE